MLSHGPHGVERQERDQALDHLLAAIDEQPWRCWVVEMGHLAGIDRFMMFVMVLHVSELLYHGSSCFSISHP